MLNVSMTANILDRKIVKAGKTPPFAMLKRIPRMKRQTLPSAYAKSLPKMLSSYFSTNSSSSFFLRASYESSSSACSACSPYSAFAGAYPSSATFLTSSLTSSVSALAGFTLIWFEGSAVGLLRSTSSYSSCLRSIFLNLWRSLNLPSSARTPLSITIIC